MNMPEPIPFKSEWPLPDARFLKAERPSPPALPLEDVFSPRWAAWMRGAAEAKGSAPDYVMGGLLAVTGSLIGNTRWASPWDGWAEPPVLWAIVIGNPSMNKSPGLDAILMPLKAAERVRREMALEELNEWRAAAEVAKVAEAGWKEAVKTAMRNGEEVPERPDTANPGPEPVLPRLAMSDATIEKLSVIVAGQPRGALLARDELAGWLQGMNRYSGGGSDRPFWLEAYGGRSYSVERMGRDPVYIDRLTVGVLGGIQPDRLRSLLMKSDDDGLLARFLPIWPSPAPVKRPEAMHDAAFVETALERLLSLAMPADESGHLRPWYLRFTEEARDLLDAYRIAVREWEAEAEGLLLSFIGKLPGIAVRLSLVLAYLDWAAGEAEEPQAITRQHFGRAAHLVEDYLLPMARRAYTDGDPCKGEREGRKLVALIRRHGWERFTTRDAQRADRTRFATAADLKPALEALEEADIIRSVSIPPNPKGGRPPRLFTVNPAVLRELET